MLQGYATKLAVKLLLNREPRQAMRYVISPVNYWRTLEYRVVFDAGDFREEDVVLDIGSPKLLALYLADKVGCRVYAVDIDDYFIGEFELLRRLERVRTDRLVLRTEDGRRLGFEDGTFTKVYSISVMEHIPDFGDSECAREIGRVLAPGGRCLVTVPFSPESKVQYRPDDFYWSRFSTRSADGKVFFQRRYSERDLHERIIGPSGLELESIGYFGENILTTSEKELPEYLPHVAGPLQPLLSSLFLSSRADSWRDLKKPLCAFLSLRKPAPPDPIH